MAPSVLLQSELGPDCPFKSPAEKAGGASLNGHAPCRGQLHLDASHTNGNGQSNHTGGSSKENHPSPPQAPGGSQRKPNILYIMADQMAAPLLKFNDPTSVIKTLHLDELARTGVHFSSAYCNSPLCAPSRFTMCTGQLPSKIGGYDNASILGPEVPTYAHYLRREGYETVLAGKMHFIGPDQLHGFENRSVDSILGQFPH